MSKFLKNLTVLFALIAYCFAIGQSTYYNFSVKQEVNSKQTDVLSSLSDSWLLPANSNENLIINHLRFYKSCENNLSNSFVSLLKQAEHSFKIKLFHYMYFERNILERLRPPDIVFPFHYFW